MTKLTRKAMSAPLTMMKKENLKHQKIATNQLINKNSVIVEHEDNKETQIL